MKESNQGLSKIEHPHLLAISEMNCGISGPIIVTYFKLASHDHGECQIIVEISCRTSRGPSFDELTKYRLFPTNLR